MEEGGKGGGGGHADCSAEARQRQEQGATELQQVNKRPPIQTAAAPPGPVFSLPPLKAGDAEQKGSTQRGRSLSLREILASHRHLFVKTRAGFFLSLFFLIFEEK